MEVANSSPLLEPCPAAHSDVPDPQPAKLTTSSSGASAALPGTGMAPVPLAATSTGVSVLRTVALTTTMTPQASQTGLSSLVGHGSLPWPPRPAFSSTPFPNSVTYQRSGMNPGTNHDRFGAHFVVPRPPLPLYSSTPLSNIVAYQPSGMNPGTSHERFGAHSVSPVSCVGVSSNLVTPMQQAFPAVTPGRHSSHFEEQLHAGRNPFSIENWQNRSESKAGEASAFSSPGGSPGAEVKEVQPPQKKQHRSVHLDGMSLPGLERVDSQESQAQRLDLGDFSEELPERNVAQLRRRENTAQFGRNLESALAESTLAASLVDQGLFSPPSMDSNAIVESDRSGMTEYFKNRSGPQGTLAGDFNPNERVPFSSQLPLHARIALASEGNGEDVDQVAVATTSMLDDIALALDMGIWRTDQNIPWNASSNVVPPWGQEQVSISPHGDPSNAALAAMNDRMTFASFGENMQEESVSNNAETRSASGMIRVDHDSPVSENVVLMRKRRISQKLSGKGKTSKVEKDDQSSESEVPNDLEPNELLPLPELDDVVSTAPLDSSWSAFTVPSPPSLPLPYERSPGSYERYGCNICGLQFDTRHAIGIHMLMHSEDKIKTDRVLNGEKDFLVSLVQRKIRALDARSPPTSPPEVIRESFQKERKKYALTKNGECEVYACGICPAVYKEKFECVRHQNTMHSKQEHLHPCHFCVSIFTKAEALSHHQRIYHLAHTYGCPVCHKLYENTIDCLVHLQRSHDVAVASLKLQSGEVSTSLHT